MLLSLQPTRTQKHQRKSPLKNKWGLILSPTYQLPVPNLRHTRCLAWTLTNACRVEALQLGAIERIERALALYLVVSWRIAHLMRMGRTCPDLDAHLFFDPDEIQAAYLLRNKTPPAAPRLNEVLRQIACLVGFLARKSDGEPGVKTIWLGLKDVHVAVKTMRALRRLGDQANCV